MFHRTVLFVEQLGGVSDVSQNCIICRAIKGAGGGVESSSKLSRNRLYGCFW